MNTWIDRSMSEPLGKSPPQFEALCPPLNSFPGENIDHYRALQAAIFRDINPTSGIEWLLAIDVAELSWEMLRYRALRHRPLSAYRQKAVEMTLRRIDIVDAPDIRGLAEFCTRPGTPRIGGLTHPLRSRLKRACAPMGSIKTR